MLHLRRFTLTVVFLVSLYSSTTAATLRFSDLNGVNNAPLTNTTWCTALSELGIGWIRMGWDLSWQQLEPSKGQWNFAESDQKVLQLKAAGFNQLPILCYTVDWAAGPQGIFGPARDPKDWENYVRTVVSRYIKPPYSLKYWQIWNEPTKEATFWQGDTNLAFIDQIYLPAARIIRELGGEVVFGGWPVSNSITELETELNHNSAWSYTDYLVIHYNTAVNMRNLYDKWVATGKIKGVWQTEIGWMTRTGYLPNFYPRVLKWALEQTNTNPDAVKLMWYASWGDETNAPRCFLGGPLENPTQTAQGLRLKTLTKLFSGGPLQARTDVANNLPLLWNLNQTQNSLEAFSVAGRTVVVLHVLTSSVTPTFKIKLSWPQKFSPSKIRRISVAGEEQELPFTWNGTTVSVDVPFSGLQGESAGTNLSFVTVYVSADPPPVKSIHAIGETATFPDNQWIGLDNKMVTRVFPGYFYIQEDLPAGPTGIKVASNKTVKPGDRVTVFGYLQTLAERQITAEGSNVAIISRNNPVPAPLGMALQSTRCISSGSNPGTSNTGSPYNTGILARVCGKVTEKQTTGFTLSDGSSTPVNVKLTTVHFFSAGDFVGVTGILGSEVQNGIINRVIYSTFNDVIKFVP